MAMLGSDLPTEQEADDGESQDESGGSGRSRIGVPLDSPDVDPFDIHDDFAPKPSERVRDLARDLDGILSEEEPEPIPEVFSGPPPQRGSARKSNAWSWILGFLLVLAIVLGGAFYKREEIIARWPVVADVLAVLHIPLQPVGAGLSLSALQAERLPVDGEEVLVVKGMIANTTAKVMTVPRLRLSLFDGSNILLQESEGGAAKDVLASGETVGFRLQLKQPSQSAQRFEVGFFAAKDAKPAGAKGHKE